MPSPVQGHFSPFALAVGARRRGCLSCRYFLGEFSADHVVCRQMEHPRVIGDASMGCAFWEREPGADE